MGAGGGGDGGPHCWRDKVGPQLVRLPILLARENLAPDRKRSGTYSPQPFNQISKTTF